VMKRNPKAEWTTSVLPRGNRMDGSRIEALLALASAKSSRAHQRVTQALDFTSAGMKIDHETGEFLIGLEFARYDLESAANQLLKIRQLYREAKL
jgi:hypothetical protein